MEDTVYVMINTTGEALHKRGYREQAGEAPLKENLAAALVLLSGWNFKAPFYDLFCGSGTIAIEAAMIAKNIAPGLQRSFAFEDWGTELKTLKSEGSKLAKKEQYDGKYTILAGDNDEKVLDIARHNAFKAGVEDMITFMQRDYRDFAKAQLVGTMVSNPPYGMRLRPENLRQMYVDLNRLFQENEQLTGGIITSFEGNDMIMQAKNYKKRKLYNGGERCYFYKKK
ncbi:MAG: hypothetical protein H6767_08300 [Candidatus Peribacteria bacterium]|nr:MAG: hypothetical protein H6767_08300 [Candidatus Peribacteria bacterium]